MAQKKPVNKADGIKAAELHFTRYKSVNNIFKKVVNSVSRSPEPNVDKRYANGKSEDPYTPFQGKIIRTINVVSVNFDRSFKDTSLRDHSLGARVGKRLHISTRDFVIRNNLFIQENTPVNAFMVADNERFLRSQEFINDARIVIQGIRGNPDSVDVTVYTKDLFSIGGGAASDGLNHVHGQLYDANLAGMGQRLELSGLYDYNRNPEWGYGGYYRKNNVAGTFIDATVGHSTMHVNSYTRTEESTDYVTLYRRLVSPYSRFAGGLTLSLNKSYNFYGLPDTLFAKYSYEQVDGWAGYNIAINKMTETNNTIRDRRFLAIRYYQRDFKEVPFQVGEKFNPVFNSSRAVLAQFTFFRQDYYKTQYVYGFGTTEDLPYGYNIGITTGLHQQLDRKRPYIGVNLSQYLVTNRGGFLQLYARSGGFFHNQKVEDGGFLLGATAYSRVLFWNNTRIRQYVNLSYTQLNNRVTLAPLYINNYYGLRGFLSDSITGTRRLSLQLETPFYLKLKLIGFRFAPFPWADFSLVTPEHAHYSKSALYTSLGGGIRARNENLIFETIEIRAYYFPDAPSNMRAFKVVTNANIRFRYKSNYINQPDLVQLNQE